MNWFFTFLTSLLVSSTVVLAQPSFRLGVRGGLNRALTTVDPAGNSGGVYVFNYSADKSAITAWQAGIVLEATFGKLALQPALLFSQKGETFHTFSAISGFAGYSTEDASSTNRYNWVELPLNVVYTSHGNHGLQVFAGPYVAVAVGGRRRKESVSTFYGPPTYQKAGNSTSSDLTTDIKYGQSTNNRLFDAGLNFGVGYRQGPVQVQVGYSLGLLNLHQSLGQDSYHNFAADAAYNRVAQLTGTYFFAL